MDAALKQYATAAEKAVEREASSEHRLTDAEIREGLPPLTPRILFGYLIVLPVLKKTLRQPWSPLNQTDYETSRAESIELVRQAEAIKTARKRISAVENLRRSIRIGWPWIANEIFANYVFAVTDAVQKGLSEDDKTARAAWAKVVARSPKFAKTARERTPNRYDASQSVEADESDWK